MIYTPYQALWFFLAILLQASVALAAPFGVVVLHTNDTHGQLHPTELPENLGGVARRASLIQSQRDQAQAEGKFTLVLDAGDLNTGTFESDMSRGKLDLKAMGLMGYDAMTIGNHEFDLPPLDLHRFRLAAPFPLLSANIRTRDGERLFRPFLIKQLGDKRVGIVGLTPPDTPDVSTFGRDYGWRFTHPGVELEQVLSKIKPRCDYVIVVSHLGHPQDAVLVERFRGRVQAWIGGHTHAQQVYQVDAHTIYSRTGSKGRFLGRFELGERAGKAAAFSPTVIPVGPEIPDHPELVRLVPAPVPGKIIAKSSEAIPEDPLEIPGSSSAMGNLYTDALRTFAGVEVAVANNGSLRQGLPAGPITDKQVYGICPFKNATYLYRITGTQLRDLFLNCVQTSHGGSNFLEVSGVEVRFQQGQLTIKVGEKPLDPERNYTLAVADFLAKGGDGYTVFQEFPDPYQRRKEFPAQILKAYVHRLGKIVPDFTPRILAIP